MPEHRSAEPTLGLQNEVVNNMNRKTQSDKQSMTPLQRQAVLVCAVCALAALLTIGITLTLLRRGKTGTPDVPADSSSAAESGADGDLADHYQIDNTSSALLTETADAGTEYLDSTLFLGDSNTVRLYNNGLISLQQFCAKEGIGTQAALNEGIVTFKGDSNHYTIAQAVAKMKPRRVVLTFGTNDTGMEVSDFISNYTALVQAIQASYPYTDIIINTVPPIPENHSTYPNMDQAKIDDFNMALLSLSEQLGVRFLNTAETLKGENGYGKAEYYTDGDIHLKSAGLKAALNYLRTHALQTEDRRPDTSNIPTRTLEYTSNPSSAVQAPSSEVASSESASSSDSEEVRFEARYQVEKSGGGTLTCGGDSGKTSLNYNITDASQSLTVTAVPAENHVFVKWSDGVTSRTRTDSKFKQNLDVTAVFAETSVHISGEGKSGGSYTFKASLSGKYAKSENLRWFANGKEVTEAAGMTTVTVSSSVIAKGSYKIYAVVSYNDCSVTSNTLSITVEGASESASSSSSSSSGSSSSSSSEGGKHESVSSSSSSSSGSSHSTSGTSENTSGSKGESSSSKSEAASSSHSTSGSSESKAEPASSSHSASSASESKSDSKSDSKTESKAESKSESSSASHSSSASESKSEAESKEETNAGSEAETAPAETKASR